MVSRFHHKFQLKDRVTHPLRGLVSYVSIMCWTDINTYFTIHWRCNSWPFSPSKQLVHKACGIMSLSEHAQCSPPHRAFVMWPRGEHMPPPVIQPRCSQAHRHISVSNLFHSSHWAMRVATSEIERAFISNSTFCVEFACSG